VQSSWYWLCGGRVDGIYRRGAIGPPGNRVAPAVAIGFLVRGAIDLLVELTR
jgi:hypothetical protein